MGAMKINRKKYGAMKINRKKYVSNEDKQEKVWEQ